MSEVEKSTPASDDMGQLEDLLSRLEAGAFARQRLIDLVRSSEAKFRLLKTQIPAMIWTMDREMRFTAIFGARISYSDPPPTELLGQSLFDYFQAENPASLYATASELMNRGETAVYELKRKQRVFQVHIGPLRERGTEILGGCGCALEITDRKEAEALVQASEQRYRELFETSEDFIYTFDLDGNFISVNSAARRVTGYDARELRQMNLAQVVAPEYRDVVRQMIESVLGGQPVRPYELEIVTKSGRRIWLEVSPRIQFVKGHPRGFHGVSHEVTERKRRELLERDRNRILELVARNETLDTILSAINGLAECQDHPAICSIWVARQGSLNHAGISKLPEKFTHGFEGLRINSAGWPGARAAALGKILTADDISTDLAWEEYRESALSQHLLASCFVPILTSAGDVLGVLAVFYPDRHSPDRSEIALLEAASHLAAVAIEHQQLIDQFSENTAEPAPQPTTHNPQPDDVVDPLTVGVLVGNKLLADQVEASLRGLPVRVVLESAEIGNWSDFMERLERLRPDVLLADISLFRDAVEDSVRAIRTSAGAPLVIALYPSADRDLILAVVRAGAREYLYPPIHTHLQRALQRILKDRDQKRSNSGGKVLGFVSAKGGCGATTVACHMAAELQRLTTRDVLLADFDMDAGMVRHLMKTDSPYSLLDAASNMYKLDLSFWRALVSNQRPGLDVISGPALPPLKNLPRDVNFRNILRFVKNHYDWVVVDLGRGLNSLAMNALEEIDETFVITTPDLPALLQAKRVVQSLFDEGFGSHRIHLVLNRNSRGGHAMAGTELEKLLGLPVYALIPDDRDGFDECYTRGELVSPSTSLGRHFTQFAGKITGAQPAEKTRRRFPSFRLKLKL